MLPEITAAFTGLKMSADAVKTAAKLHNQVEIDLRSSELMDKIWNLNSIMLSLIDRCSMLENEKTELKKKIMNYENWENEASRYELKEIDSGVFVYSLKHQQNPSEPHHFLCEKCFNDKKKSILHRTSDTNDETIDFYCQSCKSEYSTHPNRTYHDYRPDNTNPNKWMSF